MDRVKLSASLNLERQPDVGCASGICPETLLYDFALRAGVFARPAKDCPMGDDARFSESAFQSLGPDGVAITVEFEHLGCIEADVRRAKHTGEDSFAKPDTKAPRHVGVSHAGAFRQCSTGEDLAVHDKRGPSVRAWWLRIEDKARRRGQRECLVIHCNVYSKRFKILRSCFRREQADE